MTLPADFADLVRWDREIVWHAFSQMAEYEPLLIDHAEGCVLTTVDGQKLIDGVSSLWCNVHGHRHPHIDAAIKRQLDQVAHVTLLGMSHPTTVRLAKRLTEVAPSGLHHVFFSDSGASAVEVALKMAFQYWRQCEIPQPQKNKYLAFENAYHGDTLGSVSVGGVARFHEMFSPLLFEVIRAPAPDANRLPPGIGPAQATNYYLEKVDSLLRTHHAELAAIVIEPLVQAAAGMIVHPEGFLRGLAHLAQKHGILLIADEVAVGMGRTGTLFACEQEGVSPDFLCLAKGITGGYLPLAATLTKTFVWNAFLGSYSASRTFFHGHTYGGNPLGAAAALATLEVFEEEKTLENLRPKIERLSKHLERLENHPHVRSVRQCGLLAGIELVKNKQTGESYPWEEKRGIRVCQHAMTQGVWLRPLGNVLVVMPPLAISPSQIDAICNAIEQGIDAVARKAS
ncbi:MAG: adenosylmethionine--8-amino-7-oxononanoate transaminase [Planctomycetaceae bacterium]